MTKKNRNGYVYFISSGSFIKIGLAEEPMQRLAALQISNPYQLSIVKSIPGTFKTEKDFHRIFSKYRIRGEWFRNEGVH